MVSNNRVLVIGAGIVGLAVAYHLWRDGADVTVIDRDPAGDKTSFGNAGGIAVPEVLPIAAPGIVWKVPRWLLDPLGPLAIRVPYAPYLTPWLWRFLRAGRPASVRHGAAALAALTGRVLGDLVPMLEQTGLVGELHRDGSLSVYTSRHALAQDEAAWALIRSHGITASELTREELLAMEPALGPIAACGVFTPQWSRINDPRTLTDSLRTWLQAAGVAMVAGSVADVAADHTVRLQDGRVFQAGAVVIAGGAWSGQLAQRLGDKVRLESERGYNTTIPSPGIVVKRPITFAEHHFVASPLSCGLRIGGAAEFGGLRAAANYRRSAALLKLAQRYLPGLRGEGGVVWAGHRPSTPDSLPVIGESPRRKDVFYAFGHGHLGLTLSATTGRLVADLVARRPPPIDMTPYAITRFA
jgi:D-amino-acid dehydrogenase